jgi:hypothetical protein
MGDAQELFRDPAGSIEVPAAGDVYPLTPAVLCGGKHAAGQVKVNIIKLDTLPDEIKIQVTRPPRLLPTVLSLLIASLHCWERSEAVAPNIGFAIFCVKCMALQLYPSQPTQLVPTDPRQVIQTVMFRIEEWSVSSGGTQDAPATAVFIDECASAMPKTSARTARTAVGSIVRLLKQRGDAGVAVMLASQSSKVGCSCCGVPKCHRSPACLRAAPCLRL